MVTEGWMMTMINSVNCTFCKIKFVHFIEVLCTFLRVHYSRVIFTCLFVVL